MTYQRDVSIVINFNPRSPHGERLSELAERIEKLEISTHAPRTGSDDCPCHRVAAVLISTHAPRTGSDGQQSQPAASGQQFQPTLPARGATPEKVVS